LLALFRHQSESFAAALSYRADSMRAQHLVAKGNELGKHPAEAAG
jgi:hypothetical protein